jgi:multiple sugar transport system substrate-binding protein
MGGVGLAGAAFLGSGALAGCGGGSEGGEGEIVFSWIPEQTGTLEKMIQRYNQENKDGVTVKFREMPTDSTQHFDKLRTEFQAGSDNIDVIGGDVIWPAQFAAPGYYLDLSDRFTEEMRDEYLEAPLTANTFENKVYGVPWYTDSGMLYHRKDLLEKAGFSEPPTTWDELTEQAQKIRKDAGTRHGFVFQGAEYEGGVCNGLEYIWTHGGDALDSNDPTKVIVESPESLRGLETQRALIESGVAPQSVGSYKEQEAQAAFLNGDSVFMRNWPYIYGLATDSEESKVEQSRVGVSALPSGADNGKTYSALGGWNFSINANSRNPDAAWSFIQYMTSPEQQKEFTTKTARIPTLNRLLENKEVVNAVPVIKLGKQAISRTRPRPVSAYYSDLSLRMAKQFNNNVNKEVSPEKALTALQAEMQEVIEQGKSQG